MASYQKRGTTWRAYVRRGTDKPITATFDTKAAAQAWATKTEAELQLRKSGTITPHTLIEALIRYRDEVTPTKKGAGPETARINAWIQRLPFADRYLADLTPAMLSRWRDDRLKDTRVKVKGHDGHPDQLVTISPATVARDMNLLRSVLEMARREWQWLETNPMQGIRKPAKTPDRDARIHPDTASRIVDALGFVEGEPISTQSQQVAVAFQLALETGMRRGELLGLLWSRVNLPARYVRLAATKNGDARDVALSRRAVELLEMMRGVDAARVFTIEDGYLSKRFAAICGRLQLDDLRFHDTRHEAITRLAQRLPIADLARMVGHKDLRSLSIYYNATASEIARRLD